VDSLIAFGEARRALPREPKGIKNGWKQAPKPLLHISSQFRNAGSAIEDRPLVKQAGLRARGIEDLLPLVCPKHPGDRSFFPRIDGIESASRLPIQSLKRKEVPKVNRLGTSVRA
jgi:hypothetical protein